MEKGRIIIITGSPGTGKSTVASILANESDMEKSVYMHTDDFYHYLCKGAIPPYLPESNEQNRVVIAAFQDAAKRFAQNGYDVIVDGIIGPWFLDSWVDLARKGYDVYYLILRADKTETMNRALGREKLNRKTNRELVEIMWEQFANVGEWEAHVIHTTKDSVEETVSQVKENLKKQNCRLE